MRNKKGFTLIEVIGVIIIIGVIALIAIPAFMGSLNVFREDYYDNIVSTLEASGREFFTDNKIYRPNKIFEARKVSLGTLELEKYIDNVVDYEGNNCNNESYVIVIRRGRNDYEYAVCLRCEADDYDTTSNKYCDSAWLDSTKIGYTLGEIPTIYVYKGTNREELKEKLKVAAWIIKYDNQGEELDRVDGTGIEEVPEIYPTNIDTIDTNTLGEYPTSYEFNGTTGKGKVVVYENSGPNVSIRKTNRVIDKEDNTINAQSVEKTTNYVNGEWAQKITISLSLTEEEKKKYDDSGLNISKFQWRIDNKWIDLCDATDGRTCTVTIDEEMNEEGIFFRTIDNEGNISQPNKNEFKIRIDNTVPTCELLTSGKIGDNNWYIENVTVSFNMDKTKDLTGDSSDAISGLSTKYLTLSELNGSTIEIQEEDTASVTWYGYVEDRAQNYSTCNITFKKDATDPVCELALEGTPGENGWYISDVNVIFRDHKDTTSQVESYGLDSVDGKKEKIHTDDTDGKTYIGYIKDKAGNDSTCEINVKKDSTKPECSLKAEGKKGDNNWYTSNVEVSFDEYVDATSKVSTYGIDGFGWSTTATHRTDGENQKYKGYIKDYAGNENTCEIIFKKDSTKPSCTNDGDNKEWTNDDVTIYYGCSDKVSKCNPSHSGGSKLFNTTTSTATISEYTIKDNAGNERTCASRTASVYVDKIDPECTNSGDSTTWTKNDRTIYYGCQDEDSGCASGNSGGSKKFTTSTTTSTISLYTIKDKAGNSTTCPSRVADVYVDKDVPTCSITKSTTSWTSGNVTLTVSGSDANLISTPYSWTSETSGFSSTTTNTVTSNGTYTAYVKDAAGNVGSCSATVTNIDKTEPTCNITISSSSSSSITLKVTGSDSNLADSPYSWTSSTSEFGTTTTHTVTSNGTYKAYVKDKAGNVGNCEINVTSIDTDEPTCSITKSTSGWTNGNVTLTVTTTDSDLASTPYSWTSETSGFSSTTTNTVTSNGTYTVYVKDAAGNVGSCSANVTNIDKINPTCNITISSSSSSSITLKVTGSDSNLADSPYSWTSSTSDFSSTTTHTVTTNGTYTAYVKDKAGNLGSCSKDVTSIDTTNPTCSITKSTSSWTNGNVTLTVVTTDSDLASSPYSWTNSTSEFGTTATKTVTSNGQYTAYVKDSAGNVGSCSTDVTNIDKETPTCSITKNISNWTNENVTLTVVGNDTNLASSPYSWTSSSSGFGTTPTHTATTNATYTAYVQDKAGNVGTCSVQVSNIDKIKPTCTISGTSTSWTKNNRTITVGCSDAESNCNPSYSGGSETISSTTKFYDMPTYTIKDYAGNETECSYVGVDAYVDKTAPTCSIAISNKWTQSGVTATVSCSDDHSGCSSSNSSGDSYLKSSKTYSISDTAGNSVSCDKVTVYSQKQKKTTSCSTCNRCEEAGLDETWQYVGDTSITESCSTTFPLYDGNIKYEYKSGSNSGNSSSCSFSVKKYTKLTLYEQSCSTCGCETWGTASSWSDVSSCSASNNGSTKVECRTIYY